MNVVPCPFCGDRDPAIDEVQPRVWAVVCNDCGTVGPHHEGEQPADAAIERWNQRADVKRAKTWQELAAEQPG